MDNFGSGYLVLLIFAARALVHFARSSSPPDDVKLSRQAEAYAAQGNFPLAEQSLNRLLQRAQKKHGPNGIELATYLRRLARLNIDAGNPAAAPPLLIRILSIQEAHLGLNSPDLLQTLEWMTNFFPSPELDVAIGTARRILASLAAIYGENSPRLASTYNTLGLLLHVKGEGESTVFAFRRAVEISEKQKVENSLAVYLMNLGLSLKEQGQFEDRKSVV